MHKKLTAKIQKIVPKVPPSAIAFSSVLLITADDEELKKRKGELYLVVDIKGHAELETSVLTNIVTDTIHDTYYQFESISPIQSLERAIVEAKEKVAGMGGNSIDNRPSNVELNIVAAALWGNVLYIVQHGEGKAFIMREGEVKPIKMLIEGNFSAASGIVKNEDVVMLCTKPFEEQFPPDRLLRADPAEFADLDLQASCLMLKFILETSFSGEEYIDFGVPQGKPKLNAAAIVSQFIQKIKPAKPQEEVVSIRQKKRFSFKELRKFLIPLLVAALIGSVVYTILNKPKAKDIKEYTDTPENLTLAPEDTAVLQATTENDEETVPIFYDLKITDASMVPTDLAVTDNYILAADSIAGKIASSQIDTPKFTVLEQEYRGATFISSNADSITFATNTGLVNYDPAQTTAEETHALENPAIMSRYLSFFYELTKDTLYKYTPKEETLIKSVWAQNEKFSEAVSMTIDFSIYVLNKDGSIDKYTGGKEEAFELTNLDKPLSNPTKIHTTPDLDYLYVLDKGNNSIVVLNKEGKFVKRVTGEWLTIEAMGISPDETKAYILSGTKILEAEL